MVQVQLEVTWVEETRLEEATVPDPMQEEPVRVESQV